MFYTKIAKDAKGDHTIDDHGPPGTRIQGDYLPSPNEGSFYTKIARLRLQLRRGKVWNLLLTRDCGMGFSVKTVNFNEVKRQEARSRMAALRKARRSRRAAAALQKRASLVGNGRKWRITNFKQIARAMSRQFEIQH